MLRALIQPSKVKLTPISNLAVISLEVYHVANMFPIPTTGRIHFCHNYPELNHAARRTIWAEFAQRAGQTSNLEIAISERGKDELAELPMNGRQVYLSTSFLFPFFRCLGVRMWPNRRWNLLSFDDDEFFFLTCGRLKIR